MVPNKTSLAVIATLLIAITPAATRSQADFWQQTTAPKGDDVLSIRKVAGTYVETKKLVILR
jgi:hypothetical protein